MSKPKPDKSHPFRRPWGEPVSQHQEQTNAEIEARRQEMLRKFREKQNGV